MMQPMAKVYQGIGLQSPILFVMSALLLAIGIGQLRYRAWARRWSVYWGAAGLACVGLDGRDLAARSSRPRTASCSSRCRTSSRRATGRRRSPSMGPMAGMFGGTFAAMSVIVYAPYPALMLLFFTRDRVRASMTR